MLYRSDYKSPLGEITLLSSEAELMGLWFVGQRYYEPLPDSDVTEKPVPVIRAAKHWLDVYFSGKEPDFNIPLRFSGTEFQITVWNILCKISYGSTSTYGEIAKAIAAERGVTRMAAQAVGNAIARNRISIIAPCHRVISSNGSLAGYAGGIERKLALLELENAAIRKKR